MHLGLSRALPILALAACGDDIRATPDAPGSTDVSIAFAGKVGAMDFACGRSYSGIGTPATTFAPADFRFFVHDVRVTTATGDVPVALTADGAYQADGVALMDFETGGVDCEQGNTATHTAITGTVPTSDAIIGVTFRLGLPATKNHLDANTAAPPLSDTSMWWTWLSGYKFLKVDALGGASNAFLIHLGSTGCPGTEQGQAPTGPCAQPNVPAVELAWTPGKTIVADLAALVAGVDVATNTASTAPGCMSEPGDPECGPIFAKLGLPFGATAAVPQGFFSVP